MSNKNHFYNTQQMKTQIQNISHARESIQKSKDISGSMVYLNSTMKTLQPLMSKQSYYIKNFLQTQGTSAQSSQQSQMRRYTNRIFDISLSQVHQLIIQAQKYFTLDIRTNWKRVYNELQKQIILQKEKIQSNNPMKLIQFMFKVINIKDKIYKDFIKSIVYRKLLLFKDLNIQEKGFVHTQKKEINKMIQTYQLDKGYVPTKPQFQDIVFNKVDGMWNLNKLQNESTNISQVFKIINEQIQQLFCIIRNYSNLNQAQLQKQQIKRNDLQILSLRQKIQQQNKSYLLLEKKYRESISKDEKMDIVELKQKLKQAYQLLQVKDIQIKQLKYQFRDSSTQIQNLKQKVNQLNSDLQRLTKDQLIKLKQLQHLQNNLNLQFNGISQNIKNFGNIFQFENDGKKSLAKEIIGNKNTIQKMVDILGRQKRKNSDLNNQIKRLNQIILQLGARLRLKRNNDQQNQKK